MSTTTTTMATTIQTSEPVAIDDLWEISERLCIGTLRDWQAQCHSMGLRSVCNEWRIAGNVLGCSVRAADLNVRPDRYLMTWLVNGTAVKRKRALEVIALASAVRSQL